MATSPTFVGLLFKMLLFIICKIQLYVVKVCKNGHQSQVADGHLGWA